MRAILYTRYGPPDVLHMADIPKPTPRAHEVLVKVRATTVTIGDCRMRSFTVPPEQWLFARLYLGVFSPRRPILGMELAGEIEAVGAKSTRFKPGDPVFASTFDADWGGYAEYKCFPENGMLAPMPTNLDYGESAASVGGEGTALRCLKQANILPG
jgi:NADPH:quinone reductase-like Zn-dependent oxidoreductase